MQRKYRYVVSRLTGRRPQDGVDAFLEKLLADVGRVKSLFTNQKATEFVPVTIAEEMAIEETQRLLDALKRLRVPVRTVLVNRVTSDRDCPFCYTRRAAQETGLAEIGQRLSTYEIVAVPLLPYEVRGEKRLEQYAQAMLGGESPEPALAEVSGAISLGRGDWHGLEGAELILFGGKGGVGKTTSAAATALHLNGLDGKRTLIFSTDPAHSLGDSFQQDIGDRVTPIAGAEGLFALEIDAPRLLEELKQEYRETVDEFFQSFLGSGMDVPYDRAIMEELIHFTPPGLDELMALMKVMDFMQRGEFHRYILDMAPTGHALRFLELPDIVREWFRTAFRLILKYREVGGPRLNKAAEMLLHRSHQLRLMDAVLRHPQRCQFVAVTIPEAMSVAETRRLVRRLAGLRVACRQAIVNMVVPPTGCRFCWAKRSEQQGQLRELRALGLGLTEVPLLPQPVVGLPALREVSGAIYGEPAGVGLASLRRGG